MNLNIILLFHIYFTSSSSHEINQLKQVLIFSRHNVRTPMSKYMALVTPKTWPKWKEKSGHLTEKGALLEGYMGEYFSAWLRELQLLPESCPTNDVLYIYANYKQRAKASAEAFVNKGFPGCNITVYSKNDVDPLFNPVIHNETESFKKIAYDEIKEKLKSLNLSSSYKELENILDFRNSQLCVLNNTCDLNNETNNVFIKVGEKPKISGPLKIASSTVDVFVMEYFEGFPQKDVAWGTPINSKIWQMLINIQETYLKSIFNAKHVAKDISKPLLRYISDILLNEYEVPKVTLLMGHDANIYPLISAMGFNPHHFPDQYEQTPVGGKIVFQKWADSKTKEEFLKVNYVYQSAIQLRDAQKLSFENPPQFALMALQGCKINDEGFCLWKDFEKLLRNLR